MSGIGRIFKRSWKRPDGSVATSRFYSIAFPYKGRERVEGTKCDTEAGARQALRRRLEEVGRSQFLPGKTPTVRDAAAEWLEAKKIAESKRGGPVKESTIQHWENHVSRYIDPVLGDYRCDRIDTRMVERARDLWKEQGLGGKSVNKILTTLQAVFQKQINLSVLRFNPVTAAERLAVGSNEVREGESDIDSEEVRPEEVYSPDELGRLIAAADPGFERTILAVFALTMVRHGEGLALMWQDVDFEAKEITIRRSWGGLYRNGMPVFWTPKTRHGIRKVPISDELIKILKEWKLVKGPNSHDLVFTGPTGRPVSRKAAWHALDKAARASSQRRLTIHALRHTGASIHLMMGTQIPEVSAMLGHSNVNTTLSVYTHFVPKMATNSASRLAAVVFGNEIQKKTRG